MYKPFALIATLGVKLLFADAAPPLDKSTHTQDIKTKKTLTQSKTFKSFTGKILGDNVRMRVSPDLDSSIVTELVKDDYIVVTGEKGDFYVVEAPLDLKAYIFRGFIIDDTIEGDHVNIRLSPDRDAAVIGHYSTGHPIEGTICKNNTKWLEIQAPKDTRFFIAKEFIAYVGKPDLKSLQDKRKSTVTQLLESTNLLTDSEMRKAFLEIDIARITHGYETIINDFSDFTSIVAIAKKTLSEIQADYLNRKIAFLEAKASKIGTGQAEDIYTISNKSEEVSPTDRMRIWEVVEEGIYLSWSSMHHAKTMEDFYTDQKLKCQNISGIIEPYKDPVKYKPGDYILKAGDHIISYLYSTQVNLDDFIGKRVNLMVSLRPNNNFAFPAYYVLEVE